MRKVSRKKTIAVWDLGATKCAVGIIEVDLFMERFKFITSTSLYLNDFFSLDDLTQGLENNLGTRFSDIDKIMIAGAGIYDGYTLNLANGYPYPMEFAALAKSRKWSSMTVVHDYVPMMCATFIADLLDPDQISFIHPGVLNPYGRRVVFGLGTGLGFKDSLLLERKKFWLGENEVGHIGIPFPPRAMPDEIQVHKEFIDFLRTQTDISPNQSITFEKVLSGQGTSRLHQFVTASKDHLLPHEVGDLLRAGLAEETLALLAWYLGLLIGSLQLIFMPSGGIWMTGGVLLKHEEIALHPQLKKGILASPAYINERRSFPLAIIKDKNLVFLGGAYYLAYRASLMGQSVPAFA